MSNKTLTEEFNRLIAESIKDAIDKTDADWTKRYNENQEEWSNAIITWQTHAKGLEEQCRSTKERWRMSEEDVRGSIQRQKASIKRIREVSSRINFHFCFIENRLCSIMFFVFFPLKKKKSFCLTYFVCVLYFMQLSDSLRKYQVQVAEKKVQVETHVKEKHKLLKERREARMIANHFESVCKTQKIQLWLMLVSDFYYYYYFFIYLFIASTL